MEALLKFSQGPLFAGSLVVMLLGLLRVAVLTLWGTVGAYKRANDKNVPFKALIIETLGWLFPFKQVFGARTFFSIVSVVFHAGLLIVPLFLLDHILLWRQIGLSWPALPMAAAHGLTVLTILTGIVLLLNRLFHRDTRFISTGLDYLLLCLLLVIFMTGFAASRPWNPFSHTGTMLVHTLAGNLILVMIPFTKLSHCLLFPILRIASNIGWRFPARAGEAVNKTLYGEEIRKI
jgi:nitrate reductase gamma subunit